MSLRQRKRFTRDQYIEGILQGDRILLSKAITLVESTLPEDNQLAEDVLGEIIPFTGKSIRIGITGVPGVGKSTFIESLGKLVTGERKKLAVLTIDPSSKRSKGAILGDKTRMDRLATDPMAYIRPSPSGTALGGVAHKTRETMLLCEAAGYEVIFVETVGVGQSETSVHGMVDFFLLLMLAGAGDELQGIKKGIIEMADAIVITKADGDNINNAQSARMDYENALHLFPASYTGWQPKVMTCSALNNEGIPETWDMINDFFTHMKSKRYFNEKRKDQNIHWMHSLVQDNLAQRFYNHPEIIKQLKRMEQEVALDKSPATWAARQLLSLYDKLLGGK